MFTQEVDLTSREDILGYLKRHFRYWTMNSWNRSQSYAHCVKVSQLRIPPKAQDIAYELASGTLISEEFNDIQQALFDEFLAETEHAIGYNGRSGGYLVMYETTFDQRTGRRQAMPGRSIDQDPDELDELDLEELQEKATAVMAFDRTVSDLRDSFARICEENSDPDNPPKRIPIVKTEHLYDIIPAPNADDAE